MTEGRRRASLDRFRWLGRLGLVLAIATAGSWTAQARAQPGESSTQGTPRAPRRILVFEPAHDEKTDGELAALVRELVATSLARCPELSVLSAEDVKRYSELQDARSVLDCDQDSSCYAEVANALGAELLVFGQLTRLDELIVLSLTILDPARLEVVERVTVKTERADQLPALLDGKLALLNPASAAPPQDSASPLPWIGAGLLGAAAVMGLTATGIALVFNAQLEDSQSLSEEQYRSNQELGLTSLLLGGGFATLLGITGGVLLVVGLSDSG